MQILAQRIKLFSPLLAALFNVSNRGMQIRQNFEASWSPESESASLPTAKNYLFGIFRTSQPKTDISCKKNLTGNTIVLYNYLTPGEPEAEKEGKNCPLLFLKRQGASAQIQKHWVRFAPTMTETRPKYQID